MIRKVLLALVMYAVPSFSQAYSVYHTQPTTLPALAGGNAIVGSVNVTQIVLSNTNGDADGVMVTDSTGLSIATVIVAAGTVQTISFPQGFFSVGGVWWNAMEGGVTGQISWQVQNFGNDPNNP